MTVWVRAHFLTLVLTLLAIGQGAGAVTPEKSESPIAPPGKVSPSPPSPSDGHELDEYNLLPSPPPGDKGRELPNYTYPYRQALSPRVGLVATNDSDLKFTYLLGIQYLWPRYFSPQAELGADVVAKVGGHINFGVRHIFFERNYFRPFFLWGASHEVVPEDQLATFLNKDNYYVRAAIGFEDVIKLPQSVRLEIEALAGLKKRMLILAFGYSWGW